MTVRPTILAMAAALTFGVLGSVAPAPAQFFDDEEDDGPPPRGSEPYDAPPYAGPHHERRRFPRAGGGLGGSICVTARGTCIVKPGPLNAPCGCVIPGFGPKRGQIGG